jgi:hypothetical protein
MSGKRCDTDTTGAERNASVNFTLLCALCGVRVSWARLVGPGAGVWAAAFEAWPG